MVSAFGATKITRCKPSSNRFRKQTASEIVAFVKAQFLSALWFADRRLQLNALLLGKNMHRNWLLKVKQTGQLVRTLWEIYGLHECKCVGIAADYKSTTLRFDCCHFWKTGHSFAIVKTAQTCFKCLSEDNFNTRSGNVSTNLTTTSHKCTWVHIFEDAKNFCPNSILLSQTTYKQQVLVLRLKCSIVN